MRFISNGDYIFPLHFGQYWSEHVYMWSFQHGAANPDGIMRLPGRLIDILVFGLFGNLGLGYFYVLSCLAIAFLCFWWFAKVFLEAQRWGTQLIGALLFTLNPIFLGNVSKVGLILAAAMLPLCLAALKQGFKKRQFSYFLLFIVGLNISLLHPFTFSVNAAVSAVYIGILTREHWVFVRDRIWKFVGIAIVGLLLNMYFLLPIASLGSIDKGVLSDSATSAPIDYTSLVNVANTGDLFTALSLSKGVFKDYEFFGATTWPFYFLGIFLLYGLLLGVYIKVENRAKARDRRKLVASLGLFLLLMVLATATYLHADVLIKFLIGLPGGWMFRSPLKWQLYMPLALFASLVIALKYVLPGWRLKALYAGLLASAVLMNGYLCVQIYDRLLTPRSVATFSDLAAQPLEQKNLLVVANNACLTAARDNPTLATELNQVLLSKDVQVKRVSSGALRTVQAGSYDFALVCRGAASDDTLTRHYHFKPIQRYANDLYTLYRNQSATPYATTVSNAFTLSKPENMAAAYQFSANTLGQPLIVTEADSQTPSRALHDIFGELTPETIRNGFLRAEISLKKDAKLYAPQTGQPLFYKLSGNKLAYSTVHITGTSPVGSDPLSLPGKRAISVSYVDPTYSYQNLVLNPSLEHGLWQREVGDCNAYDDRANLAMSRSDQKTDGVHSLQLEATEHIACTGPKEVRVTAGQRYMLSFDYQSEGGATAGYFVGFDDTSSSSESERLPDTQGAWQNLTTTVTAPLGAETLKLMVYAFPGSTPGESGTARYDNLKLVAVPAVGGALFAVENPTQTDQQTKPKTEVTRRNPTKQLVRVTGASAPFYLSTKESYAPGWQLNFDTGQGRLAALWPWTAQKTSARHIRLNSSFNGWYVEPATLCAQMPRGCAQNSDGSYTLALVMEFMPQRWFYTGGIISMAAVVGAIGFVWHERRTARTTRTKGGS